MKPLSALLLFFFLSIYAGTALSADSKLPPELQALFVEAPDEILLKPLPNFPKFDLGPAFWVDDQRVIFTSREFNGWIARKDEKSKILIHNVDTGETQETPYRGNLRCFGLKGEMRIQDYPLLYHGFIQPGDTEKDALKFIWGILGWPPNAFVLEKPGGILDSFTCQYYQNKNASLPAGYYFMKLREEDGVVEKPGQEIANNTVRLRDSNEKIGWETQTDKFCNFFSASFQYLSWNGTYYAPVAFGAIMLGCGAHEKNSWIFSRDSIQVKPLPELIREARRTGKLYGNGITFWARRGMYVYVHDSLDLNGLFWEDTDSKQLKRVLKRPWGLETLSPNGCRALIRSKPVIVIELCREDKK